MCESSRLILCAALAFTPDGQRDYLSRLICPSGARPTFDRIGSIGPRTALPKNLSEAEEERLLRNSMAMTPLAPGESDYHWIDAYEVRCGKVSKTLYMDMYHCAASLPDRAPEGFDISP